MIEPERWVSAAHKKGPRVCQPGSPVDQKANVMKSTTAKPIRQALPPLPGVAPDPRELSSTVRRVLGDIQFLARREITTARKESRSAVFIPRPGSCTKRDKGVWIRIGNPKLAERMKCSLATVKRATATLTELGFIRKLQTGRSNFYRAVSPQEYGFQAPDELSSELSDELSTCSTCAVPEQQHVVKVLGTQQLPEQKQTQRHDDDLKNSNPQARQYEPQDESEATLFAEAHDMGYSDTPGNRVRLHAAYELDAGDTLSSILANADGGARRPGAWIQVCLQQAQNGTYSPWEVDDDIRPPSRPASEVLAGEY